MRKKDIKKESMKIFVYPGIACMFLLLFVCVFPVHAQLFGPFESFRVIKTEEFDIIYPKESELSARLLASYADDVYKDVSTTLGIQVPGRISVVFAPHTDLFNGYYNPVSTPHIMLYDTAIDIEWTTFENNLKELFHHELTHAVSLNSRGPFYRGLRDVFGSWAAPPLINAPSFMVEGASVSFESLAGFGRSNDPLIKQKLRQAIYEGKFLSPFQASGVYDLPDQSGIWYEYGGLFSTWLQNQYGMEKYAELWQAMGKLTCFSFSVYRSGFYRIYKNVYNVDFMDSWNAFRDSLALRGIEENNDWILPPDYRFFAEKSYSIGALAQAKGKLYMLDNIGRKIRVYNTYTAGVSSFGINAGNSYDLDVSPSGSTILVSGYNVTGYQMTGNRYRAVVTEFSASSGRGTGRNIHGLYKARYFRDGVVGIATELHNNCIVYADFKGNRKILFRGNDKLMFSGPQVLDNDRIVFIAASGGQRALYLYNYASGELFRIDSQDGNTEIWRDIRGLSVSDGKIIFSHDADDRMYKLALIDPDTMQAVFSSRDFSGGVFNPVAVNGEIFYRGNFFAGDRILRFPEAEDSLSGKRVSLRLTKPGPEMVGAGGVAAGLSETAAQPETAAPSEADAPLPATKSKPYMGIAYMNPFRFWVPLPLLRFNFYNRFDVSADGFGLLSYIMDPTDRNMILAVAFADIRYRMAMIDYFTWQSTVPGIPVTLNFTDKVIANADNNPRRETRADISGVFARTPGSVYYGLTVGAGFARNADYNGRPCAYDWTQTENRFYFSAALTFSNIIQRQYELFGTGISLTVKGMSTADVFMPRFEGLFQGSAETRFPLKFAVYGAWDTQGMDLQGSSKVYGSPVFSGAASAEYSNLHDFPLAWIAGAELSAELFSVEIQNHISHLYFNRLYGALSVRNVLFDGVKIPGAEGVEIGDLRLAQSLVLKLGLTSSIIPLKMATFFLEPNIWAAWKFSNTITGSGPPLSFGAGFGFDY